MEPIVNKTTLVLGGCRSGKSSHALELAEALPGDRRIFIATCVPYDKEMRQRVLNHQKERDNSWQTIETPIHISAVIERSSDVADVILVDCLTLWISNLMAEEKTDDAVFTEVKSLRKALTTAVCPVILVSNEVGSGIVPENALARRYRDLTGYANRQIAATADRVIWTVAGIPVTIKPSGQARAPW
jgi:adenosylcobinamide kinase/adenosylcobinamide-phosphate guanylyltransferase